MQPNLGQTAPLLVQSKEGHISDTEPKTKKEKSPHAQSNHEHFTNGQISHSALTSQVLKICSLMRTTSMNPRMQKIKEQS